LLLSEFKADYAGIQSQKGVHMSTSTNKKLALSQCVEGMLFYKRASGKSPSTTADYRNSFDKLQTFFAKNPPFVSITRDQLVAFFAWLQDEYVCVANGHIQRKPIHLSPKTILNIHIALSALWTWAVNEGLVEKNIVRTIDAPRVQPPVIETFSKEQIEALLKACDRSAKWKTKESIASERPTADRDRAIVLLLLDSGIRAQELCDIRFGEINLSNNNIKVKGKGSKERIVYFGKRTAKALWKYILPRLNTSKLEDRLFLVGNPDDAREMDRHVLCKLLQRIGERAGVPNVHPHRFRHSFAITYLRNGGDVFTLQSLLGHSDLTMVKHYARIAQTDCAKVHQTASPVDNWRL
jgi:integrase/recombinase XerD